MLKGIQKPLLGQQINWAHPLARSLVGCWVMNEGSGGKTYDSVAGREGALSTLATRVVNGINLPTNEYINMPLDIYLNNMGMGKGPFSLVFRISFNDIPNSDYRILICADSGSNQDLSVFQVKFDWGTHTLRYLTYENWAGQTANAPTTTTFNANITYDLAVVWDGTNVSFYCDGLPLGSAALGGNFPTTNLSENRIGEGFNDYLVGKVYSHYYFDRVLTPSEIAWLHREPYAMFEREKVYLFGPAVSSSSSQSTSVSSSSSSESVSTSFSSSSESISASSSSSSCSLDPTKTYSRGDYAALPGGDVNLETLFTCPEYPKVATDDDIYVQQTAAGEYALFLWKNKNDDNESAIIVSWKGKSDRAPSVSTVYLQIYNRNTSAWEALDSDNITGAGVEFVLSGAQTTNLSFYYDAQNWVSCRVYQQAT